MRSRTLSEILLETNLISPDKLKSANSKRVLSGESLLESILTDKMVSFPDLSYILDKHYGIPTCDLNETTPEKNALILLDYSFCMRYKVIPIRISGFRLVAAMRDPINNRVHDDIFAKTGCRIEAYFAPEDMILSSIHQYYGKDRIEKLSETLVQESSHNMPVQVLPDVTDAPAVALTDSLLDAAAAYQASDIHIEVLENYVRVRFRVDGHLRVFKQLDPALLPNIIARLKVMSNLDVSQKRLPQDGHFYKTLGSANVDFRLSTIPTYFGEKAAIRLIYKDKAWMPKEALGFEEQDLEQISALFNNPYGAVLLTGPTGCGKSTTLSSFLSSLNDDKRNIVTIEDPVEHVIPGITQINVNPKAGLTFANALRSILRQDPDILMVGEIRDEETAQLAIQAAITGHLLLSTLHTYDAASTITRLADMNVPGYLTAAALRGIISQRLVRRICESCKTQKHISKEHAKLLDLPENTVVSEGVGCPRCGNTGYKGRVAVYEYLIIDDELSALIDSKSGLADIRLYLAKKQFVSILETSIKKVIQGVTTTNEVISNVIFS
ncbi:MAG: GspE/PulE family protein [Clostridiales bacterium]|nr:GspE/PulE family protein [Clostridiales bacterium]